MLLRRFLRKPVDASSFYTQLSVRLLNNLSVILMSVCPPYTHHLLVLFLSGPLKVNVCCKGFGPAIAMQIKAQEARCGAGTLLPQMNVRACLLALTIADAIVAVACRGWRAFAVAACYRRVGAAIERVWQRIPVVRTRLQQHDRVLVLHCLSQGTCKPVLSKWALWAQIIHLHDAINQGNWPTCSLQLEQNRWGMFHADSACKKARQVHCLSLLVYTLQGWPHDTLHFLS